MMRLTFFIDWMTTPLHWVTWNLFKALKIKWYQNAPSLALRLKLVESVDIPEGSILSLLNFEALKVIEKQTSYFKNMEINENLEFEKSLLNSSSLSWYPHEVACIRIRNTQNEIVCSKIFHGKKNKFRQADLLKENIRELVFYARKKGLLIEEIELAHTHPSIEVMIEEDGESQFVFNGLSHADQRLGQQMAEFLDYPLRVKAITPTANYSHLY